MRIEFSLSMGDVISASRLQAKLPSLSLWGGGVFGVAMTVSVLSKRGFELDASDLAWTALWAVGMSVSFGLAIGLAFWAAIIPLQVWRTYRQNQMFYSALVLVADDTGLEIENPKSLVRLAWTDLRGFKENGRVLLLCPSKSLGLAVPKGGLPDDALTELRGLLTNHLRQLR